MTYGFLAFNDNNQVLVSSETRNLHFIGKPALFGYTIKTDRYGGGVVFTYRVNSPVPVVPFFSLKTTDYHCITAIRNVGGTLWEIELLTSGYYNQYLIPEVYVFADPRASTATERYGMLIYRDDGTPSFDSRLRPLAITGGFTVAPPSNPRLGAIPGMSAQNCGTNDTTAFTPDNYNAYSVPKVAAKEIMSFSSLAQTQKQVDFYAQDSECDGFYAYGECVGVERNYYWTSRYWCYYRAGIARAANGNIHCGWIPVEFGCNWDYRKETQFIGIGTGGSSGVGGAWPYSNETLNLSAVSVISANGARYD